MNILDRPDLWFDFEHLTNPRWWEATNANDAKWWFTSAAVDTPEESYVYYKGETLPASLKFDWEITVAPSGEASFSLEYTFDWEADDWTAIVLGDEVSAGSETITIPDGSNPNLFAWRIPYNAGAGVFSGALSISGEGDNFNCSCDDETGYKTLAELRADIINRLGFVAQKGAVTGKTLGEFKDYLMARLGFAAQIGNPPPGMPALLTAFVNEAQATVWRRYAYDNYEATAPADLVDDADECTLDTWGVQVIALANAKGHYGQDSKPFYEQFETYLKELLQRSPLNLVATINSFLRDAQQQLYRNYSAMRTERFYRWTMRPGERYYDLPDNDDDCAKKLDVYKITWVGVEDLNGTWTELAEGISPTLYTSVNSSGMPARYEVRQCIEVFPAPADSYTLRIKGHFGLQSFTGDTDKTTIDDHAVFLLALGLSKAHYGQKDAQNYFSQTSTYVGSLVAGSHHTARYVPGANREAPASRPRFLPLDS